MPRSLCGASPRQLRRCGPVPATAVPRSRRRVRPAPPGQDNRPALYPRTVPRATGEVGMLEEVSGILAV